MYIRKTMTADVIMIDKNADILEARAAMVVNQFTITGFEVSDAGQQPSTD